jgi:hypothetical protein
MDGWSSFGSPGAKMSERPPGVSSKAALFGRRAPESTLAEVQRELAQVNVP